MKPSKHQNSGIQTCQILTNDDEVCIPSLSSILLAVSHPFLLLITGFAFPVFLNAECILADWNCRMVSSRSLWPLDDVSC